MRASVENCMSRVWRLRLCGREVDAVPVEVIIDGYERWRWELTVAEARGDGHGGER